MADDTHSTQDVSLEQWKRIFALAEQVRRLEPWEWMTEEDLFGVEEPATGAWGVVSVMGEMGEHLAVTVLHGSEGFYGYIGYMYSDFPNPLQLLQVPMTQLVFGHKSDLSKEQLALIKRLKLKPKGRNAWVYVDDYTPGFLPAFALTPSQASLLEAALSQLLEVAPRVQQDEKLLYPSEHEMEEALEDDDTPNMLFWRVPQKNADSGEITWRDEKREVPLPTPAPLNMFFDIQQLEKVRKLPKYKTPVELDVSILPTPFEDDSPRPYFPYLLLAVNARTQEVIFTEVLRPLPSLQAMYDSFAMTVLGKFIEQGKLPSKIHSSNPLTEYLLKPLTSALKIKVELRDRLPALDIAMGTALQFTMQDMMDMDMDDFGFEIDPDDLLFLDDGGFDLLPPKPTKPK